MTWEIIQIFASNNQLWYCKTWDQEIVFEHSFLTSYWINPNLQILTNLQENDLCHKQQYFRDNIYGTF